MDNVLNTLASIRTNNPNLANEKIDSAVLLRALTLSMDSKLLYRLGKKQKIQTIRRSKARTFERNEQTRSVQRHFGLFG